MKKLKFSPFSIICLCIGILLIAISAIVLVNDLVSKKNDAVNAEQILLKVEQIIPDGMDMYPEERYSDTMPSMEIDGIDVAGIIEVPKYNMKSVINSNWDKNHVFSVPCRFTGSVYNRTLIIGSSDYSGQFDFANTMNVGEIIYITDMEGGRYTYSVEKIEHSKNAETQKLQSGGWDMTVFVKQTSSNQYLFLRCKIK